MKAIVTIEKEVDLKTLHVQAGVRYWEDATINDVDDEEGNLTPCRVGECWCPVIEIDTGKILNWPIGTKASIHFKVCDSGTYIVKDDEGNDCMTIENDYVPSCMSPKEAGYGDYIIMDIYETGYIADWSFNPSEFGDQD